MSEASHRLDIFLPGVPGVRTFQAESGLITQEWTIRWKASQIENWKAKGHLRHASVFSCIAWMN